MVHPPTDSLGRTPLHCAAVAGSTDICALLISRGHPVDCIDTENHMPIWYARVKDHTSTVALLAQSLIRSHVVMQSKAPVQVGGGEGANFDPLDFTDKADPTEVSEVEL